VADENTIVVYITDNGGSTCNFGDNAPLRGTKYTLWDGGIRIPMIWRWPAQLPAGRSTYALISSMDLVATLARAAGASVTQTDGLDIFPALTGTSSTAHDTLHWDCGFQWAVRSGSWKLSWVADDTNTQQLKSYEHAPMGNGWFLTDLSTDLAEQANQYAGHPDVVARLHDLHTAWRAEVGLPAS
jgi:arylsulfatase A-like enzyme